MCAVFRRDRLPRPAVAERGDVGVTWLPDENDWSVEAPCDACGGYRMLLQVSEPEAAELASTRAAAFLARIHARGGCLGCEARTWREGRTPPAEDPQVWWDTETGQWMVWTPVPEAGTGASLPLGINTLWAPKGVRAAARAMTGGTRLPQRIATSPDEIDRDGAATIHYDVGSGRRRLWAARLHLGGLAA